MKKMLFLFALILVILMGLIQPAKEASAFGIIGGADGPTSVFIASKVSGDWSIGHLIIGLVCILLGFYLLKKKGL